MKQITYQEARDKMLPGDLIAFGGRGYLSTMIKMSTRSHVSHVGTILQSHVPQIDGIYINQVIESTSLGNGFAGVQINQMSMHILKYDGEIWWLPLSDDARDKFDSGVFFFFMMQQVGKEYDAPQAIGSALDYIPDNDENLEKLFCSELVAAGLEKVGVLSDINASEQTPIDICRLPIFQDAYQLKGDNEKELC